VFFSQSNRTCKQQTLGVSREKFGEKTSEHLKSSTTNLHEVCPDRNAGRNSASV